MTPRCSRVDCRTSLTDETTVNCPHDLPFCEHCTWEEGCIECAVAANVARLAKSLDAAVQQARTIRETPPRWPVVVCRCGASEDRGRELGDPVVLHGARLQRIRNEGGRPCRACPHYIHHGADCVVRYYDATTTVRDHYHPECVVTS